MPNECHQLNQYKLTYCTGQTSCCGPKTDNATDMKLFRPRVCGEFDSLILTMIGNVNKPTFTNLTSSLTLATFSLLAKANNVG